MVCLSAAYIAFFIEVRVAVAALRIGMHIGQDSGH
jgi:hypothetical protein